MIHCHCVRFLFHLLGLALVSNYEFWQQGIKNLVLVDRHRQAGKINVCMMPFYNMFTWQTCGVHALNLISMANVACFVFCTHVKISQLVTSLQTSRQQDVFALLVP